MTNGVDEMQNGNTQKAISYFSEAIKVEVNNPNGYYLRGQAYIQRSELDSAIFDFRTAILKRDTFYYAYYFLAYCFLNKKDTIESEKYVNKTLKLNPNYLPALKAKSSFYLNHRNSKQAKYFVDKSYDLAPDDIEVLFDKGIILMLEKNFVLALPFLEKSYQSGNRDADFLNGIAECYRQTNSPEKGLIKVNEAIAIDSMNASYYINKALILRMMNLTGLALKNFDDAIKYGAKFDDELKLIYKGLKN